MTAETIYRRVVLKLSGEALCSQEGSGIDPEAVSSAVDEILGLVDIGVQVGIVVGAGNLLRGRDLIDDTSIARVTADHMGMLATVINAVALRDSLQARGRDARAMSAIPLPTICEPYSRREAVRHLQAGRIVLFAGGTGSPFFTTDTTAALRACEIDADLIVKGTKVEGVYDSDPVTNPDARKFDRLTYQEALARKLAVMDQAAFSLCSENRIPIVVCRLFTKGNLAKAVRGEPVGTIVAE